MAIDLKQVVVVNESSDADHAGPIYLFKNTKDAESYLEPIDVENEEFFAYMLDGRELRLSVVDNEVRIEPVQAQTDHRQRIRSLLETTGKAVQLARKRRGISEDPRNVWTMSIADLIRLIGFA